jgi:hypothetical protein
MRLLRVSAQYAHRVRRAGELLFYTFVVLSGLLTAAALGTAIWWLV